MQAPQASKNPVVAKKKKSKKPKAKVAIIKTKLARNEIGANWKNFLSQEQNKETLKDNPETKTERYTGPFRRARKLEGLILPDSDLSTKVESSSISKSEADEPKNLKTKTATKPQITKYIAMDCEMVGVGDNGEENMLARVSLVNKLGDCIYDKFVAPREEVVDFRTNVSGIRPENLKNATAFETVAKEVAEILHGKILVGHAVHHDLEVLLISHPRKRIRDTSRYKPFRKLVKGKTPGLRKLAKQLLDVDIQKGEHSSIEDARAAMQLYITHSKQWETQIRTKGVQVID